MLSQTVEYALRAVVHLATVAPESCRTADLAAVTQTPIAYLSKLVQNLNQAGIVTSRRGTGGGISLAIEPEELTLLEVVNAVDPLKRIKTCPLELNEHGTQLCALHRRLDAAYAQVEAAFAETTLAEIVANPKRAKPLCSTK